MIQVEVSIDDNVSSELREFISILTGADMADLNEVGARRARNAATDFHHEFNRQGGWRGKRYMQGSLGNSGEFGSNVAEGWAFRSSDATSAIIGNNADYYRFKVDGGPITPKRVSALTIPLIPDAKGRRAADYEIAFNTRLFRPRGTNVLMERVGGTTTGVRGKRGAAGASSIKTSNVRAVYALVKSVTMPPFPQGLPPQELLADEFSKGWLDALTDKIELL